MQGRLAAQRFCSCRRRDGARNVLPMSKPADRDPARILRSIKRPSRGTPSRAALEPNLIPFETLSPIRTIGREETDFMLIGATHFESLHTPTTTGFAAWESGASGNIIIRFTPAPYGYTGVGTFVFGFTLHAVSVRATFQIQVGGGTLVGSSSVSVAADSAATVTNIAANSTVSVFLSRVSGGSWRWFQTSIREPGLVIWPPFDKVLSDV
jgi:hypothetical protein